MNIMAEAVRSTKAKTLLALRAAASHFRVLPGYCLTYEQWRREGTGSTKRIRMAIGASEPLIVRSSAASEDGSEQSQAGKYLSVLGLHTDEQLSQAIDDVFSSYGDPTPADEVFIQPMAQDVALSGVVMTCDPDSGLPYCIVSYDESGDTTVVTSGGNGTRTYIFVPGHDVPKPLRGLLPAIDEVVNIVGVKEVDIEFAITNEATVVVFQVRPITTRGIKDGTWGDRIDGLLRSLNRVKASIEDVNRFNDGQGLVGHTLGVMPDLNPAELIGTKPRSLAASLYRHLLSDTAWATAREKFGYRDLRSIPLVHMIGGTPYVSVSASVASFIPATVPEPVAQKVIADAQRKLNQEPELHDKIEFRVVPTCLKPRMRDGQWRQQFSSLSDDEWASYLDALGILTNRIVSGGALFDRAAEGIERLESAAGQVKQNAGRGLLDVLSLIEKARVHGTVLFAEVARAAFVATDILKSLEAEQLVPQGFLDAIVCASDAVGAQLVHDFAVLEPAAFLKLHGHIRPGTYEITVPRYDDPRGQYFDWVNRSVRGNPTETPAAAPVLSPAQISRVCLEFDQTGYAFGWPEFEAFAMNAIQARERVKHAFSWLVSDALEQLALIGADLGLNREELSFLTLPEIALAVEMRKDLSSFLRAVARRNRRAWETTRHLRLPDVLCSPKDIFGFHVFESRPSFITGNTVEGLVTGVDDISLKDGILFIENADPGFDWVFTRGIKGIVTKFGGENSHMSIRARELGLPAVIGAGSRFESWRNARVIRLECAVQRVEILR
ncbi:PEP/pyruvate-binding domain-containing protein [Microvirga lotononidis]|nr:PEP/pyruvate-binding domain-containing protein [Microvirga lotononidis]WQO30211.1 PEP/pyruvate-binding domain-containing protein [Microvirga lotononidis]